MSHLIPVRPKDCPIELDFPQVLSMYLAGTVPFPTRYPEVGDVSIQIGVLNYAEVDHSEKKLLVVVKDSPRPATATTHIVLAKYVAAIFFYKGEGHRVDDFEHGEWVLGPFTEEQKGSKRGIVFVPEHRPVISINEVTQTAAGLCGRDAYALRGCECHKH